MVPSPCYLKRLSYYFASCLVCCVMWSCAATAAQVTSARSVPNPAPKPSTEQTLMNDLIPRDILFGNPDKLAIQLSPGGSYLSYVAPYEGVLNIYLADRPTVSSVSSGEELEGRPITFDKGKGIHSYQWLYDSQHIVYSQDKDGDENHGLFMVDINNARSPKRLTPEGAKAFLVGVSYLKPDEIVYAANDRNKSYFDLYRYTISTGKTEKLLANDSYTGFILDSQLNLAFLEQTNPDGSADVIQVKLHGGKEAGGYLPPHSLKVVKTLSYEDKQHFGMLGLSLDNSQLYMLDATGADSAALKSYDVVTGRESVVATPPVDAATGISKGEMVGIMLHPKTYAIQSYTYNYDKPVNVVLDATIKADMDYLAKLQRGTVNVVSRTLNDDYWVVAYLTDDGPVSYYLYDRSSKKAEFLFHHRKDLDGLTLARMQPVVIPTRDGLPMVSYLSLPPTIPTKTLYLEPNAAAGASSPSAGRGGGDMPEVLEVPTQPIPMVLFVHGGPAARDSWGYDPAHQFFTNRGYAVLAINYRGSQGFGKKFLSAGDGEWSGKMHDDLLDAVDWAIKVGVAQKDKIAIFGGSYGGYATLVALTFTPDVFACGVDIVGPSNLETLYDSIPPYWEPERMSLEKRMGGHTRDEEGRRALRSKSPLHRVDAIQRPLLIAQGANDPRVKQAESDQIVAKMVEKNIPVTYLLYPNEGHGFARPENRLSFFGHADKFLSQCLGGSYEPFDVRDTSSSVVVKNSPG